MGLVNNETDVMETQWNEHQPSEFFMPCKLKNIFTLFALVLHLDMPLLSQLYRLNLSGPAIGNLRPDPYFYALRIIDLGVYNIIPKTLLKWRFWGENSHSTVSKGGGKIIECRQKQNKMRKYTLQDTQSALWHTKLCAKRNNENWRSRECRSSSQ